MSRLSAKCLGCRFQKHFTACAKSTTITAQGSLELSVRDEIYQTLFTKINLPVDYYIDMIY